MSSLLLYYYSSKDRMFPYAIVLTMHEQKTPVSVRRHGRSKHQSRYTIIATIECCCANQRLPVYLLKLPEKRPQCGEDPQAKNLAASPFNLGEGRQTPNISIARLIRLIRRTGWKPFSPSPSTTSPRAKAPRSAKACDRSKVCWLRSAYPSRRPDHRTRGSHPPYQKNSNRRRLSR